MFTAGWADGTDAQVVGSARLGGGTKASQQTEHYFVLIISNKGVHGGL